MENNLLHIKNNEIVTKPEYIDINIENEIIYITISKDCEIEVKYQQDKPLHTIYQIKKNSHVSITETKNITDRFTKEMIIEEDASVALFSYDDSNQGIDVNEHYTLHKNSFIETAYCDLESHDAIYRCIYDLVDIQANAKIRLAALTSKKDQKQFDLTINHKQKQTYGEMSNYGVCKNESKLVINGIGRIERGNNQSEAHQTSKIMIFDEKCKAEANPYLYIDEYDVKASHAASVGKMDQEHLYYLQSRGLNNHEAMQLITLGYLMPVVDVIRNEGIKNQFIERLQRKIGD